MTLGTPDPKTWLLKVEKMHTFFYVKSCKRHTAAANFDLLKTLIWSAHPSKEHPELSRSIIVLQNPTLPQVKSLVRRARTDFMNTTVQKEYDTFVE